MSAKQPEWKPSGDYAEYKRRKLGDGPPIAPGTFLSSLSPFSFAWGYQRRTKLYLRLPRIDVDGRPYFGVHDRDFLGVVATSSYGVVGLVRLG